MPNENLVDLFRGKIKNLNNDDRVILEEFNEIQGYLKQDHFDLVISLLERFRPEIFREIMVKINS